VKPLEALVNGEAFREEGKNIAQEFLDWLRSKNYRALLKFQNASIFLCRKDELKRLRLSPKVLPVPVEYVVRELREAEATTEEEVAEIVYRGILKGIEAAYGRSLLFVMGMGKLVEFRRVSNDKGRKKKH
jgi:hypothetical protein